jgi:glyoxylase-like metal-dependent hydrolase (beta-lactamase superfamily II)
VHRINPHLQCASCRIANIWLLTDREGRRFLIDSGHPIERPALLASLWTAGVRMPGDLAAVLLTHRHSDHAGNAAWLRKRFGARVICHENDAAALSGRVSAPPLVRKDAEAVSQFGRQRFYERWLCSYEDHAPAHCEVDELYDEGAWKWGFRIVPVPGHTEGSVMLYHEPTRTLFSGDAILVGTPLGRLLAPGARLLAGTGARLRRSRRPAIDVSGGALSDTADKRLRLADPGFSYDAPSCHLAVRRFLRQLPPIESLCSGHGPALEEGVMGKLEKLKSAV